ncbi:hypothetical protein GY21_06205 [Cryobacterium roopkundense]|uniref:Uncharacterized protein n=1 Tax=Cryobacterium roopkundense TaxID=1001240 RepID=A0A099JNY2_9MICO|nr:hypothetical protein [Cryobacterium roopkundense]KGJ79118.1 hypothetical protein GY21_06205 [Cryobacterium roopkundense]MBB5643264.1 hypothetical protein [Cryobacterium roopkundense]
MDIEQWWPRVTKETRDWLIANNGEGVPPHVTAEITAAGGVISADTWWIGEATAAGFTFSDEATDWIEAVANGERPAPR